MTHTNPSYFFDLSSFRFKELFSEEKPVWEALDVLDKLLKTSNLGEIQVNVPRGTFLENKELISIGEGTVVEEGAYIRGPCIIGKNCTIRHGAYIRGGLVTGDGCVVGHATEIKNSILLNGAHAAHFAYLGDSILGNRVNLGAGVKCANLKLDHGDITVLVEGKRLSTGRHKLGAIIGDDTQIGCNSVTNPGTLMGPGVKVYPCTNVGGFVLRGKTVR